MPRRKYSRRTRGKKGKVRLPEPKMPAWKKLAGIAGTVADKVALLPGPIGLVGKSISAIKNLINVETKFVDTDVSVATQTSTGTIKALTLMAQGATDQTRVGNSILSKNVSLHGRVVKHASATASRMKWAIILDKENGQGSAPTAAQIFTADSDVNFINMDNSERFVILKSGMVELDSNRAIQSLDIHHDLSDLHVRYDGANATQANATTNHLYLYTVSNEATNGPAFSGIIRYRFYDN